MDFIAWALVAVCFAFALSTIWLRPDLLTPHCPVCSREIDANEDTQEFWSYIGWQYGWQVRYCRECLHHHRLPTLLHEEIARNT